MRKYLFVLFLALITIYTTLGFVSYQFTFPLVGAPPQVLGNTKFYDYSGISHVQTRLSTGSGSLDDLAAAASQSGSSFLIVTDLNVVEDLSRFSQLRPISCP